MVRFNWHIKMLILNDNITDEEKGQSATFLSLEDKAISIDLVCRGGELKNKLSQVKRKLGMEMFQFFFQKVVSVEKANCSKKQEPRIIRTTGKCSRAGADGRRKG